METELAMTPMLIVLTDGTRIVAGKLSGYALTDGTLSLYVAGDPSGGYTDTLPPTDGPDVHRQFLDTFDEFMLGGRGNYLDIADVLRQIRETVAPLDAPRKK